MRGQIKECTPASMTCHMTTDGARVSSGGDVLSSLPAHECGQLSGRGGSSLEVRTKSAYLRFTKFRHRQPVAQPTITAAIMTSGRGLGILGVNTCHRCIEYLVFGLFDCGVGEIDCSRRIVLG